jgi:transglutaminase-like putative cysteine protease
MGRVFRDGDWLPSITAAVVIPTALAVLGATWRQSGLRVLGVSIVLAVAYAGWVVAPETTTYGIPGPATFRALGDLFEQGIDLIGEERAPVLMDPGRQLLAIWGVWACTALALWLASDAGGVVAPLAPPLAVLVFVAISDKHRTHLMGPAFFVGAAVAYLVLAARPGGGARVWCVSARRPPSPAQLAAVGIPIALLVTLLSPAIAQRLPGAEADALVDWRNTGSGGPGRRVTISPFISVRARLTQQPPAIVFTVQVDPDDDPSRWRLMALEDFNGEIWRSSSGTEDAGDVLRSPDAVTPGPDDVVQRTTIVNLDQEWVPAAAYPVAIDRDGLVLIPETQTLLVDDDLETSDGLLYTVISRPPTATPDQLRAAGPATPAYEEYLQLPDIDPRVAALATQLTQGLTNDYDKAFAIQSYLRLTGGFTYDQTVPAGQGNDALVSFLFESQRGYCEQFAASFAVLARAAGVPTRVAVGFTPGTFDPTTRTYTVTTEQAHAWPEVWFEGHGWLAFEPTPGRGAPTPDYSGTFDDAQAPPPVAETTPTTADPTATTGTIPGIGLDADPNAGAVTDGTLPAQAGDDGGGGVPGIVLGVVAAVAVVVGSGGAIVGVKALRRRRRHGGAPVDSVAGAWAEAVDRLTEAGIAVPESQTPLELAADVRRATSSAVGRALAVLAEVRTRAAWSGAVTPQDDADTAWSSYTELAHGLDASAPWHVRLRRRLDVRPLVVRAGRPRGGGPAPAAEPTRPRDRTPAGV